MKEVTSASYRNEDERFERGKEASETRVGRQKTGVKSGFDQHRCSAPLEGKKKKASAAAAAIMTGRLELSDDVPHDDSSHNDPSGIKPSLHQKKNRNTKPKTSEKGGSKETHSPFLIANAKRKPPLYWVKGITRNKSRRFDVLGLELSWSHVSRGSRGQKW